MYGCGGYLAMPSDSDSIGTDSLTMVDGTELIEVKGEGNLNNAEGNTENATQTPTPNNNGEATEKKD